MNKKVILMILDGWGIATNKEVSAVDKASTPFMDLISDKYPSSTLEASGMSVGLPSGQMGNSEVGHMNIGAGRVVYQDLVKINKAVNEGTLLENAVLRNSFEEAKVKSKDFHFIGLLSDGGVHSHIDHLKGLLSAATEVGLKKIFIHVFTDGRDTNPKMGKEYVKSLQDFLNKRGGCIASIIGRYYSMDRDKRWERIKFAYDAMVLGKGEKSRNLSESIESSYRLGITDEFIKPIIAVDKKGMPVAKIKEDDFVLCFNFRTDRGRQITQALTQQDFPTESMKKLSLSYMTLTNYDDTFKGIRVVYEKKKIRMSLGEVLELHGKKQLRIAETEKYPHVTFFFSGGREDKFNGEKRLLCPSPKVATYDLKPEMSAEEIKNAIIPQLQEKSFDFVCLNFANPDMVGHTGVFDAAIKACEVVDQCAKKVIETASERGYAVIVIADHGNSDIMINADGSPHTAHTTNLVPFILVDDAYVGNVKPGKLGDIAPTILSIMGLPIPKEMTGEILVEL